MAIEILHEKIRKLKNPSMVDFSMNADCIPPHILEDEGWELASQVRMIRELLEGLKGIVPAVRFSFGDFALMDGLTELSGLLKKAGELGYYVVLDGLDCRSPWSSERLAKTIFGGSEYPCDGLVISPYIGSDAIRPFVEYCQKDKDLFVVLRSPNKSASELQDLLTGGRLVHGAAAEQVNRFAEIILTKCGYSRIGGAVSAGSPNSIRTIRSAYKGMYLLVDGLDYPSGNHKNCSHAFDRMGYGAVVSAGSSITAAWKEAEEGSDYVECARQAAERMKKNLLRYVTIL